MEVSCKTKDTLPLEDLIDFQGNLKQRSEADYDKIVKSIKKHGFSFPFFVWQHDGINSVLDGHGRLGALNRMVASGEPVPPLPVVYVDCKDEADAKEKLLKLNSHYGSMTAESVAEFIGDLDIDIEDLALPMGALDLTIESPTTETVNDDEIVEVDEDATPQSQLGEIYELGEHLLMCGDSTKEEDLQRLMGGTKADLWITDPPYNVALGMGGSVDEARKRHRRTDGLVIMNDKMGEDDFRLFLFNCYSAARDVCKPGGAFYIWHADSERYNFEGAMVDLGVKIRQTIIWNKNTITLGRQDYQWKHEPCLYGWWDGDSHSWYSDRKQATVIDFQKPAKSELHPTMKPVGLFEYQIKCSSKKGDIVLDSFGGSGTTIIACAKNGRKARVMELDPKYCDAIRKRWTKWARENGIEPGSGALEE